MRLVVGYCLTWKPDLFSLRIKHGSLNLIRLVMHWLKPVYYKAIFISSANKKKRASARPGEKQKQQMYLKSNPSAEPKCQTLIKQIVALCTRQSRESTYWANQCGWKGQGTVIKYLFPLCQFSCIHKNRTWYINWMT